jgi:hypothetical protein
MVPIVDVPGETSTGSIGILISEVKYVEQHNAMKAMGDVGSGSSGRNVINVMSGFIKSGREGQKRIEKSHRGSRAQGDERSSIRRRN